MILQNEAALPESFRRDVIESLDRRISQALSINRSIQKNRSLQKIVQAQIAGSDLYTLLFNDEKVAQLAVAAITATEKSLAPYAFKFFLDTVIENGFMHAFKHTPLPEAVPLEKPSHQDQRWITSYFSIRSSGGPGPESLHSGSIDIIDNRMHGLFAHKARYAQRSPDECDSFNDEVLYNLTGNQDAYRRCQNAGFNIPEWWPSAVEMLATRKNEGIRYFLRELEQNSPQRGEYHRVRVSGEDELSPAYVTEPRRADFSVDGQNYVVEMERSFVNVFNIWCDREMRDNQLTEFGEGIESMVKVISHRGNQFMSVYQVQGDNREYVGAAYLKGLRYKKEGAIEYYDEIGANGEEGKLQPLRASLLNVLEQWKTSWGYQQVIFDSDEIIRGLP